MTVYSSRELAKVVSKYIPMDTPQKVDSFLTKEFYGKKIAPDEELLIVAYTHKFVKSYMRQAIEKHNKDLHKALSKAMPIQPKKTSKLVIGSLIQCKASDFELIDGYIRHKSGLFLKSVRIHHYPQEIVNAIEEPFIIVVEKDSRFAFQPYNGLSRILECCECVKRGAISAKGLSILSMEIEKAKKKIDDSLDDILAIDLEKMLDIAENYSCEDEYDEDDDCDEWWSDDFPMGKKEFYDVVKRDVIFKIYYDFSKINKELNKYHINGADVLGDLNDYINQQSTVATNHLLKLRDQLIEDAFSKRIQNMEEAIASQYVFDVPIKGAAIKNGQITLKFKEVNPRKTGEEYYLHSKTTAWPFDLAFSKEQTEKIELELNTKIKHIEERLKENKKITVETGLSVLNTKILITENIESLPITFSLENPKVFSEYMKDHIIFALRHIPDFPFCLKSEELSDGDILAVAIRANKYYYGDLMTFSKETYDLYASFKDKYRNEPIGDYFATSFPPMFKVTKNIFTKHPFLQDLFSFNPYFRKLSIYVISENYAHASDIYDNEVWLKDDSLTYFFVGDGYIYMKPTDSNSASYSIPYPKGMEDFTLLALVMYFTDSWIDNKRKNFKAFKWSLEKFFRTHKAK